MESQSLSKSEVNLESVITTVVKIPGIKVNRDAFLAEMFHKEDIDTNTILEVGTIEAGCSREMLSRIANRQILKRTSESSIASFVTGLPGGLAMAATIPADVMQFFGMALRLAQELANYMGHRICGRMAK